MSFNRTIMELKYIACAPAFKSGCAFNRTIMELKLVTKVCSYILLENPFNRTIMELKPKKKYLPNKKKQLLIVPLWN